MDQCIFCKIINGEIPSHKLYEDDKFIAILDKFPSSPGHILIIPKNHAENIYGLSAAESAELYPLVQKIAIALKDILSFDGLNILQNNGIVAGQTVFHFHVHLIPRYKDDSVTISWQTKECQDHILTEIKNNIMNQLS